MSHGNMEKLANLMEIHNFWIQSKILLFSFSYSHSLWLRKQHMVGFPMGNHCPQVLEQSWSTFYPSSRDSCD